MSLFRSLAVVATLVFIASDAFGGLSTAGVAFRATSSTPQEPIMIQRAFGAAFQAVSPLDGSSRDIRNPGNIAVESKNGVTFVYNGEYAGRILFGEESVDASVLSALGNPELVVVFCHYDSGNSFGYVIVEHGVRTRYRLYTRDKTIDEGVPRDFERSWLKAAALVDGKGEPPVYRNKDTGEVASEDNVTAGLLDSAMRSFFGIIPWTQWDYKSKFNYYRRVTPTQAGQSAR